MGTPTRGYILQASSEYPGVRESTSRPIKMETGAVFHYIMDFFEVQPGKPANRIENCINLENTSKTGSCAPRKLAVTQRWNSGGGSFHRQCVEKAAASAYIILPRQTTCQPVSEWSIPIPWPPLCNPPPYGRLPPPPSVGSNPTVRPRGEHPT